MQSEIILVCDWLLFGMELQFCGFVLVLSECGICVAVSFSFAHTDSFVFVFLIFSSMLCIFHVHISPKTDSKFTHSRMPLLVGVFSNRVVSHIL